MFWLCVGLRVLVNPLSNVLQKLLTRARVTPLFVIGMAHGVLSLVCAPVLVWQPLPDSAEFWWNMTVASTLAVAGNVLIVRALQISDLSLLGPVNAYKPLVSLLPGMVLLHEVPALASLAGMVLILGGSGLLVAPAGTGRERSFSRLFRDRGVQYRIGGLVLSAIEAVFLKRAVGAATPLLTFAVWSCAGFALAAVSAAVLARRDAGATIRRELRGLWSRRGTCLALAATTGLMQLCTLVILTGLQVAPALALFQTSSLITVLLGRQVFQEPHFARRLLGGTVMVAGAVLIIVSR